MRPPTNERSHMRHHLRPLVRRALPIPQVVPLRQRPQLPHSDLPPGEPSLHSQRLLLLPLSCRNLRVAMRHPITDAPRLTTSPLLSLVDTRRISVHRSHHRNKLHTTHNTMQISTSDNSHRTLPSQERNIATASHTHTLNPHSLHLSNLLLPRNKTLDSSSSSQHQH